MWNEFAAITKISMRSLPARIAPSLIVVVGVGGVVAVVVALLATANGFEKTLQLTGQPDRALVLRAGSTSEINGNIPLGQFDIISRLPHVARDDEGLLASRETFVTINMLMAEGEKMRSLPMRGVTQASFRVRSEVKVVSGRRYQEGKYELIAGKAAAAQFRGLTVGKNIRIRGIDWLVVGLFETNGSAYESEIWVDERLLAQSWKRGETFSSMLIQLDEAANFGAFEAAMALERRLQTTAFRESDYYAKQAESTASLMQGVGLLVATIMAVGSVFAALNTMFAALATRTTEIATYRALGFHRIAIVAAVLVESMCLAAIGAVVACILIILTLDGTQLSTVASTSSALTQVAFPFRVTPEILYTGLLIAVGLGLVGGLFPALKAATMPITAGLRSA